MRPHLLAPDVDADLSTPPLKAWADVVDDLELNRLWDVMADGDDIIRASVVAAMLHPLTDVATIAYRQDAVDDALEHPDVVRAWYELAHRAATVERGIFMMPVEGHPEMMLTRDVRMLDALADCLEQLREECARNAGAFTSDAFTGFCRRVARDLSADYLARLREQSRRLTFPDGLLMSARLGVGGQVTDQVLRLTRPENHRFLGHVDLKRPHVSFTLPDRDIAGAQALSELRDRSVDEVSNAASQAVDHIVGFASTLRAELAVLLGAVNLAAALNRIGSPICRPAIGVTGLMTKALYDPCLALRTAQAPIPNDVAVPSGAMLVVTGSNHGGKSTLLRAIGVAHLMAQAGLFVAASTLQLHPVGRVFTHWAREEDRALRHGKLDEELTRMTTIVQTVRPGDLLLSNESFASTNEAEGSQLAHHVMTALADGGVDVALVTHLFDLASRLDDDARPVVFLRAPRSPDGSRSYRLEPGPPLDTSFGLDLFDQAFGTELGRGVHPC